MPATAMWAVMLAITGVMLGLGWLLIYGPAWAGPTVIIGGITILCVASDLTNRKR